MLFDFKSKVYFTGLNKISKKKNKKNKTKTNQYNDCGGEHEWPIRSQPANICILTLSSLNKELTICFLVLFFWLFSI